METPGVPMDDQENTLDKEIGNTMGFSQFMNTQASRPRPNFPPHFRGNRGHRGNRGNTRGRIRGGARGGIRDSTRGDAREDTSGDTHGCNRNDGFYNQHRNRDYNNGPPVNPQGPLTPMTESTANSVSGPPSAPNPNTHPDVNANAGGNSTNNQGRHRYRGRRYWNKFRSGRNKPRSEEVVQAGDKSTSSSTTAKSNTTETIEVKGAEEETDSTREPKGLALATHDKDNDKDIGQEAPNTSRKADEGIDIDVEPAAQAGDKTAKQETVNNATTNHEIAKEVVKDNAINEVIAEANAEVKEAAEEVAEEEKIEEKKAQDDMVKGISKEELTTADAQTKEVVEGDRIERENVKCFETEASREENKEEVAEPESDTIKYEGVKKDIAENVESREQTPKGKVFKPVTPQDAIVEETAEYETIPEKEKTAGNETSKEDKVEEIGETIKGEATKGETIKPETPQDTIGKETTKNETIKKEIASDETIEGERADEFNEASNEEATKGETANPDTLKDEAVQKEVAGDETIKEEKVEEIKEVSNEETIKGDIVKAASLNGETDKEEISGGDATKEGKVEEVNETIKEEAIKEAIVKAETLKGETDKDDMAKKGTAEEKSEGTEKKEVQEDQAAKDTLTKAEADEKHQGEENPTETQTAAPSESSIETDAEADVEAGQEAKPRGTRPKRKNHKGRKRNFHCPNGETILFEDLRKFDGGVRTGNGDMEVFRPTFIEDNPWKDLKPVPIARTPYRLFYDADD